MNFSKKRIVFERYIDVDVFTEQEVNERLNFYPEAGNYYYDFHRYSEHQNSNSLMLDKWTETWYSKVIIGYFIDFNRSAKQLSLSDRLRAYPAKNDGEDQTRRSIIFFKEPKELLLIKLST